MNTGNSNKWEEYAERHNRTRRERYRTDPDYKKNCLARNRAWQRDRSGGVELRDCGSNHKDLARFGQSRNIVEAGEGKQPGKRHLVFTAREVAEALDGYTSQAVYRWLRNGQLPAMTTLAIDFVNGRGGCLREHKVQVYTFDEMRAVLKVLAEHQKEFSYYTRKHSDTRQKLEAAFKQIKQNIGDVT